MHQMMRLNMKINFLSYLSLIRASLLFQLGRVRYFKRAQPLPATSVSIRDSATKEKTLGEPINKPHQQSQ